MNPNALLIDQLTPVVAYNNALGNASGTYYSLKNYERVRFTIVALNATTVTGSPITIKQATAVAGTGEKALSFTTAYRNIDLSVNEDLAAFAVVSDTFTLDATNSKRLKYVVEINVGQLDVKNDFDCIKMVVGTSVAQTITVLADFWPGKYQKQPMPSVIVD